MCLDAGRVRVQTLRVDLVRVAIRPEGAFGVLKENGLPFAVSLERTFARLRVVIPEGRHLCRRSFFNRGGYWTFEITGIDGHQLIKFHRGNWETDSTACVLVGRRFGTPRGKPGILESKAGFSDFMQEIGERERFYLNVSGG